MKKYITAGNITALCSVLAIIAGAFGKGTLEHWLEDPATTQTILTLLGSIGTLVAGAMQGVKQ